MSNVALFEVSAGVRVSIDESDLQLVVGLDWTVLNVKASRTLYAKTRGRKPLLMHRLILSAPDGLVVDHVNGDGLDNRRANLRLCTRAENLANRAKCRNSRQPYKGVRLRRDKPRPRPWVAEIGAESRCLGHFATAEEAAAAYDRAAVARFGEFACLNFPHRFPSLSQRTA